MRVVIAVQPVMIQGKYASTVLARSRRLSAELGPQGKTRETAAGGFQKVASRYLIGCFSFHVCPRLSQSAPVALKTLLAYSAPSRWAKSPGAIGQPTHDCPIRLKSPGVVFSANYYQPACGSLHFTA